MSIYEKLNQIDNDGNEMGVSPLSYVIFNCAK